MATISRIRLAAVLALTALCLCSVCSTDARADHWEDHIDLVYDQTEVRPRILRGPRIHDRQLHHGGSWTTTTRLRGPSICRAAPPTS